VEAVGGGPVRRSTRVLGNRALSESAFEVQVDRPAGFSFEAGQSIRVFSGNEGRDYSLAGSPSAANLVLVVRRMEGGAVSPALVSAAPGAAFDFTGPHGLFTLKPSPRPVILVGTGVGIAPFLSMAHGGSGFTLLHGARSIDELFYRKELEGAADVYVPCLSRESSAGCFHGRVTEWARKQLPPGSYDFYLCGGRHMVRDMILLVDERFPGSRVYTEIFF
jgi:benzoate/toluate 1,2-dioxygenase reductase component